MQKLKVLLNKLCPNGVEYKTLGEIATDIYRGNGIKRNEVREEGVPCVRYGEIYTTYGIWFDKCVSYTSLKYVSSPKFFEHGDILFAITGESVEDIAKSCAYMGNEKCMAGGDIVVLKHDQDPQYLAYALSTTAARVQKSKGRIKSKVVHSNIPAIKDIRIPVPPMEVQHEIVQLLDKFLSLQVELQTQLQAELTVRKMQYECYRNKLLKYDDRNDIEWKPIGEIGDIIRGKRFVHKDDTSDGIPAIHYGELYTHYGVSAKNTKTHIRSELRTNMRYAHTGDVIIVGAGENKTDIGVGVAWVGDEEVAVHDACFILTNHNQDPKYLSYCLRTNDYHRKLFPYVSEGKICSFLKDGLAQVTIPIPKDINEQKHIAGILDKFDKYITDLSEELSSEIKARQKQYEYYRDKLLTFKEAV